MCLEYDFKMPIIPEVTADLHQRLAQNQIYIFR